MKNVVITGASGVVGTRVLHHLLGRDDVGHVLALGRRMLPVEHAKLTTQVVDLADPTAVAEAIDNNASIAICGLGTTLKRAGSKEAFRAVDHDAVLAFAEAALEKGAERFLLVSAVGANARSANFYQRTKGEAEDALARLGYPQLTILRPSLIDDEGRRAEYRPAERLVLPLARVVFSVVGKSGRYAPISADVIAKALVYLAFDNASERVRIVESNQLHVLGR